MTPDLPLKRQGHTVYDAAGYDLCYCPGDTGKETEAHAAYIVKAGNGYPALLEACKLAQYAIEACWLRGATSNGDLCRTLKGVDKDKFEEAREQLRTLIQAEQ